MTFSTNIFTASQFEKTKFFKELAKYVSKAGMSIETTASKRNIRIQGKVTKAIELQIGSVEATLYLAKDGDVITVVIDDKVTNDFSDKTADTLSKDIFDEVVRVQKHKQKAEMLAKVSDSNISKVIEATSPENDTNKSELERLKKLKSDLTKGSGKFIVINPDGRFLEKDKTYTNDRTKIKVFDDEASAKEFTLSGDKIVSL